MIETNRLKIYAASKEQFQEKPTVREMRADDWERVAAIYTMGLENGFSTFNTACPTFAQWDAAHRKECRYVSEMEGKVVGWIAVSPTSARPVYSGVVEVSIYVDAAYHGKGIGTALMAALIDNAPALGFWSLYSVIITANTASIAFHKKCGFREIGYRERIARDKFGEWQNVTLMEYRLNT